MKQFDIFTWRFPHGEHPAVIVSPQDWIEHKPTVNVLACSSHRARRPADVHELILDDADGLDWQTLCRCDHLFDAPKDELIQRRGHVAPDRQIQLVRKVVSTFAWRLY